MRSFMKQLRQSFQFLNLNGILSNVYHKIKISFNATHFCDLFNLIVTQFAHSARFKSTQISRELEPIPTKNRFSVSLLSHPNEQV